MENEVRAVMTSGVVVAEPDTTFIELVGRMSYGLISALPVVDRDRRVLGIVSEGDLLLHQAHPDSERRRHWLGFLEGSHTEWGAQLAAELEKSAGRTARELMTAPAITIGEHESLQQAAHLMETHHVKRLPVVDAEGRLAGIVSRADLLRAFLRSDRSVRLDVERVLRRMDPPATGVEVEVHAGAILLTGHLPPGARVADVIATVENVPGVVEVTAAWGARRPTAVV